MKKMMMVFVVLFAMVGSSFGEWINNATIVDVRWYGEGFGFVTVDETSRATNDLTTPHLYFTEATANRYMSLGLAALNNGNPVILFINKSALDGGNNAKLEGLIVKKKN